VIDVCWEYIACHSPFSNTNTSALYDVSPAAKVASAVAPWISIVGVG
jgi:hypothetical protein